MVPTLNRFGTLPYMCMYVALVYVCIEFVDKQNISAAFIESAATRRATIYISSVFAVP